MCRYVLPICGPARPKEYAVFAANKNLLMIDEVFQRIAQFRYVNPETQRQRKEGGKGKPMIWRCYRLRLTHEVEYRLPQSRCECFDVSLSLTLYRWSLETVMEIRREGKQKRR